MADFIQQAKQDAAAWAREVLADPGTVILDSETTSLEGELVEVAIITATGEPLLNTLIKPEGPISPGAARVHGITVGTVQNAPTFPEVYPDLQKILASASRVVIYNAVFDNGRIDADCTRHELPLLEYRSECVMLKYAEWYGEWSDYDQSFRWQRLNGGHRALGDCEATLERIREMAEVGGDNV